MENEPEIECPHCGCPGEAELRQYIDVRTDASSKRHLRAGKLALFCCSECRFRDDYVSLDVLYHDREPLAENALRHGFIICFSCSRSLDNGERYYCVCRTLRERGGGNPDEDRILEETSSLQVCVDWRKKAMNQRITFPDAPLPLLKLERDGFRRFARRGRCGQSRDGSGRAYGGSCTFCFASIGRGDRYTTIVLDEEISTAGPSRVLREHALLAAMCNECAEKYLVWLWFENGYRP